MPRSAYSIFGLFDFFFQSEQYFSLTTIQSEQCFSAKILPAKRGQRVDEAPAAIRLIISSAIGYNFSFRRGRHDFTNISVLKMTALEHEVVKVFYFATNKTLLGP